MVQKTVIPFHYLALGDSPAKGYWDQELIADLLHAPQFVEYNTEHSGAIVILPGAYQANYIKEINDILSRMKWVVLIITSDEESKFPVEKIRHDNIRIYVQYPKRERHDAYGKFPIGYTKETRKYLRLVPKDLDYFISGQDTHERRHECFEALKDVEKQHLEGVANQTPGFTQGLPPDEYMEMMIRAKTAPAPSGPISADSFRAYEALEAGTIPIADNISPAGDKDFWDYLIGTVPFPTIDKYENLPGYIEDTVKKYPYMNNVIQAWWIKFKHDLRWKLIDDACDLSGQKMAEGITVVIPVSPIKSHPDTAILEETVQSIRTHLPDAEIIITFDGVRKEHEDKREKYNEFIRRALFHCNTDWNATPILFKKHEHQVGMARAIIDDIRTPSLLYVEQDTPLTPDMPIDFDACQEAILSGKANVIRFHFESFIPAEHKHMMLDNQPIDGLLRTAQWSQRPHLASTAFYRRILTTYFTDESCCFIEDLIHGKLHEDYVVSGELGWNQWRVYIYHPEGNIKRSYHTDGRAGEKKLDNTQVW